MDRNEALLDHLRSLPTEQLADVLGTLDEAALRSATRGVLYRLTLVSERPGLANRLTTPHRQLLRAAAELADPQSGKRGYDPAMIAALNAIGHGEDMTVDWQRVLDRVGADSGERRRKAEAAVAELAAQALTWPSGRGDHHLALGLVQHYGECSARLPTVAEFFPRHYNVGEVRRVALALGIDPTRARSEVERDVVAALTDQARLSALFAAAPPGAVETAVQLAAQGAALGTFCFVGNGSYPPKYRFREGGSGDPDTDWLAEHGLLVPYAAERAVLPKEVRDHLRDRVALPFTTEPPAFDGAPVDEVLVRDEGRAALLGFLGVVDRLVAEVGRSPLALRKSGGVTARDQKRLARAVGQTRERARLWIAIAVRAGALVMTDDAVTAADAGSGWFRAGPAERLAALLHAWMELPDAPTWWPEGTDPVVPLSQADSPAVPFRTGMLLALSGLSEKRGSGISGKALLDDLARGDLAAHEGLWWLFEAAAWHRAAADLDAQSVEPYVHIVREAELVGAIARGGLTPVGRALVRTNPEEGDPGLLDALRTLLPPEETTARFQGDLTATVMGTPATSLERLLSTVADREGDGYASVWRLSTASVRRALDEGHTCAGLIEQLTAVSADGLLPQTLEYLVKDTARTHGRVRVVAAACCVRCADAALAGELVADRALAELSPRLIAEAVLVSQLPPEQTVAVLRKAGYMPVQEDASGEMVIERGRSTTVSGAEEEHSRLPYLARRRFLESCARRVTG